jgi:hypothetical protein
MTDLLDSNIHQLKVFRCRPKDLILILFVTSSFSRIIGLEKILKNWPNTNIAVNLLRHSSHPVSAICQADIILIGDELEGISAPDFAEMIRYRRNYPGIIASIVAGENPCEEVFKHHFGRINEIGDKLNTTAAKEFIAWINSLINEAELNYFPYP